MSAYYQSTSHAQILAEDREIFRRLVDGIGAGGRLSDAQKNDAVNRFVGLMDQIYLLTIAGLKGGLDSAEQQARFNRIFKLI